jgi:hypothetical protein
VIVTDAQLADMICAALETMSDEEKAATRTQLYLHFGLSPDEENR